MTIDQEAANKLRELAEKWASIVINKRDTFCAGAKVPYYGADIAAYDLLHFLAEAAKLMATEESGNEVCVNDWHTYQLALTGLTKEK